MVYKIDILPGIEGCVYKLWYADKYVVVKCKTLWRSVHNIESGLHYFLKGTPKASSDYEDYFYQFFQHIKNNPFRDFKIELLLSSNNPYQLLKAEHTSLNNGKSDEQCLNKYFNAYVPQNTQVNGKRSWINRGYYLNFCIWKKKLNQNKTE